MKINSSITESASPDNGGGQASAVGLEPRTNILVPEKYLTKGEVAARLRKTTRTIDFYMAAGILPYMKIGRSVLFDWDDVQRHLNEYFRVSRFSGARKSRINTTNREGTDQ
jgi:excisionase family DNA binding protein